MRIIRYLVRSINPLNILLFIIMVAAAICVLFPLMKINAGYSLPQVKPKTVEETEKPQEKSVNILPSDYTVIGELNLFHPERRIPVDKKAEEIPKPELILYGTMVQDNVQYAFIEDKKNPKTTPGRGNRQTTIKKGDVIGGFVVSEIGTDRITLTKGDEKMTVLLTKRISETVRQFHEHTETNTDTYSRLAHAGRHWKPYTDGRTPVRGTSRAPATGNNTSALTTPGSPGPRKSRTRTNTDTISQTGNCHVVYLALQKRHLLCYLFSMIRFKKLPDDIHRKIGLLSETLKDEPNIAFMYLFGGLLNKRPNPLKRC